MNPKALQYIMGHANITMTLNYYAHATYDSAKAEMERLAAYPNRWFYYRRTTFGFKIMPRSIKICQVSPDMANGEKVLKSKTYRHLPRYEKIG